MNKQAYLFILEGIGCRIDRFLREYGCNSMDSSLKNSLTHLKNDIKNLLTEEYKKGE